MRKEYILTFSITFLVVVSVFIILLMLMLPQQIQVLEGNINKYDAISKSKYTYESTKDISNEVLEQHYTITSEDMTVFKNNRQYQAGNSDPFSPSNNDTTGNGGSGSSNTSNNKTHTSGSTSTSTQDKITNSNGGVANPPSTSK